MIDDPVQNDDEKEFGSPQYYSALKQQIKVNQNELFSIHLAKQENKTRFILLSVVAVIALTASAIIIFYYYNFRSNIEYQLPEVGAVAALLISGIVASLSGLRSSYEYIIVLVSLERRQEYAIKMAKEELEEASHTINLNLNHG